ncbi:hypothetical protein BROSI_A1382 [Candidatus Brocadia sinica JPN1]|uniref:Uncharacterized protein n=1 Tax=Candidatus Brocadia sinica JPN1 TaxID=1197129 RepID=A0ABQ0JW69_9BACT|nr:hypothetical protein BROSI_A1382 [Candidatus Brocadia sinica JPN1]
MRFAPWISPDDSPALINILQMLAMDNLEDIPYKVYDEK